MFFSMIFYARCDMVMLQRGSSDRTILKALTANLPSLGEEGACFYG